MLVKFFTANYDNKSAKNAVKYLLREGDRYTEHEKNNVRVLRGNPYQSAKLAETLSFTQQYKVGCLSFEESNLSEHEKIKIMDSFERMAFGGLARSQYDISWIEHTDKGRLELNFFVPSVELDTGKRLQVYYDRVDKKLFDAWRELTNIEHNLSSPADPSKKKAVSIDKRLSSSAKAMKEKITQRTIDLYRTGQVTNQDELVAFITKNGKNIEVTRQGKDYISIQTNQFRLRLRGAMFEKTPNPRHYRDAPPTPKPSSENTPNQSEQKERLTNIFNECLERKIAYNQKKYHKPFQKTLLDAQKWRFWSDKNKNGRVVADRMQTPLKNDYNASDDEKVLVNELSIRVRATNQQFRDRIHRIRARNNEITKAFESSRARESETDRTVRQYIKIGRKAVRASDASEQNRDKSAQRHDKISTRNHHAVETLERTTLEFADTADRIKRIRVAYLAGEIELKQTMVQQEQESRDKQKELARGVRSNKSPSPF